MLLCRRQLLSLGTLLALPAGCAPPLHEIRTVNFDALAPEEVLLLGRVRITAFEFDYTSDTFLRTNLGGEELLLPPDGDVAWVVRRPPGLDLRLVRLSAAPGSLYPGLLLLPREVITKISYFGTLHVTVTTGNNNRSSGRGGKVEYRVTDEHAAALVAFVKQNPALARREVYDVVRHDFVVAPGPAPAMPSDPAPPPPAP